MHISFTFIRETPRFKFIPGNPQGKIVPDKDNTFAKGKTVVVSCINTQSSSTLFEVWIGGNPHFFDPIAAGCQEHEIKQYTETLTNYDFVR